MRQYLSASSVRTARAAKLTTNVAPAPAVLQPLHPALAWKLLQ